jgi:hypothetical protein
MFLNDFITTHIKIQQLSMFNFEYANNHNCVFKPKNYMQEIHNHTHIQTQRFILEKPDLEKFQIYVA